MLYKTLLSIHVFSGFISLLLFWIPMFTKKGGQAHRKVGQLYVYFMGAVVITATILSIMNATNGHWNKALFLGFLSILTGLPLWYGTTILKQKKQTSKTHRITHQTLLYLLLLYSVFLLGVAICLQFKVMGILYLFFGILGISVSAPTLKAYWTHTYQPNWLQEHYGGMIISGTAAYTAFFVFGGANFFESIFVGNWQILPWVLPTILTVFGMRYFNQKYLNTNEI